MRRVDSALFRYRVQTRPGATSWHGTSRTCGCSLCYRRGWRVFAYCATRLMPEHARNRGLGSCGDACAPPWRGGGLGAALPMCRKQSITLTPLSSNTRPPASRSSGHRPAALHARMPCVCGGITVECAAAAPDSGPLGVVTLQLFRMPPTICSRSCGAQSSGSRLLSLEIDRQCASLYVAAFFRVVPCASTESQGTAPRPPRSLLPSATA